MTCGSVDFVKRLGTKKRKPYGGGCALRGVGYENGLEGLALLRNQQRRSSVWRCTNRDIRTESRRQRSVWRCKNHSTVTHCTAPRTCRGTESAASARCVAQDSRCQCRLHFCTRTPPIQDGTSSASTPWRWNYGNKLPHLYRAPSPAAGASGRAATTPSRVTVYRPEALSSPTCFGVTMRR
jgi:hypothetical protein